MTDMDKARLVEYRQEGKGCAEIARLLHVSVNTVKSYCRRNDIRAAEEQVPAAMKQSAGGKTRCKQCGTALQQTEHTREKMFCSDKCRMQWWHAHRSASINAEEHICPTCQRVFTTDRMQKYCCHECYILSRFGRKKVI